MASWNTRKEKGILTGKYYEYVSVRKPILCCISGDEPNSKLKELIEKYNLGFCFEQANADKDAYSLKKYILQLCREFDIEKRIHFMGDEKYIKSLSYENISAQFEALFSSK